MHPAIAGFVQWNTLKPGERTLDYLEPSRTNQNQFLKSAHGTFIQVCAIQRVIRMVSLLARIVLSKDSLRKAMMNQMWNSMTQILGSWDEMAKEQARISVIDRETRK